MRNRDLFRETFSITVAFSLRGSDSLHGMPSFSSTRQDHAPALNKNQVNSDLHALHFSFSTPKQGLINLKNCLQQPQNINPALKQETFTKKEELNIMKEDAIAEIDEILAAKANIRDVDEQILAAEDEMFSMMARLVDEDELQPVSE
jgi:hypothetical protein